MPSMLFNTLVSLFVVSIGYTLYIYARFKYVQEIDKRVIIKGESVKLIVKLCNEDIILYPFIHVSFFGSHSLFNSDSYSKSLCITPFSRKEFVFDMECRYRGQYEVGISDIYIEDFFGLIKLQYRISETKKIIVYPKIEHIGKFDVFSTNSFDTQNSSQGTMEDINNIKDMRNYQYGDSYRKIHWKLSARNNKLMIKNYQNTSDANVNILLDLRPGTHSSEINIIFEDKLIEAAVAILNYYLYRGIPVNYLYFDQKIEILRASNRIEFDFIYKTLSTVIFDQTASLADIVQLHYESSTNTNDMVILTSMLDVELYNEIYKAQMTNHSICLIYISPKTIVAGNYEIVDDILDNLPEIGIRAFTINPADDIKLILGG